MGKPHFRAVERCIFCENKADSGEHGWPRWTLTRLGFEGGVYGSVDGIPYADLHQRHVKVRCVCEDCNIGWMKGIEDAVIPTVGAMMLDEPRTLDNPQQWLIAQWVIKTAMVFEHINRTGSIFYADEERIRLRISGFLPPRTAVWIARTERRDTVYTRGMRVNAGSDAVQLDGLVTTVAYGHIAIQVVTVRIDQKDDGIVYKIDGDEPRWSDAKTMIWPTASVVEWPRRMSIAPGELDAFHGRFSPDQR